MPAKTNCQVTGFLCFPEDLCKDCGGDGQQRPQKLFMTCERCFDEMLGFSTGIEPGTRSHQAARGLMSAVIADTAKVEFDPEQLE